MDILIFAKYKRKSSEPKEKQALSLEQQEIECARYIKQTGIYVPSEFDYEESKSSFKPNNRRMFDEMMSRIECGQINSILTWKEDRLCRNPEEGGRIIQLLQNGTIKEIRCVATNAIYTPNSDHLLLLINFGIANQYSRNLSQNVKRGLSYKCEQGEYPRPAPIGYVGYGERGQRKIKPHRVKGRVIAEMFQMAITMKFSLYEIAQYALEKGLTTETGKIISKSHVYSILSNRIYCGDFYFSGQMYRGTFKPIVTRRVFDQAQEALKNRSKPKIVTWSRINKWNGLARCSYCNCAITTTHKVKHYPRTNRTAIYDYMNCTQRRGNCPQPRLTQTEFETELLTNVQQITIDREVWDLGIKVIKAKYKSEADEKTVRHKYFEQQYHAIQKRLNNLINMRADGEITKDEFIAQKNELLKEQGRYEALIKDTKMSALTWLELTERFLDTAFDAQNIMLNGDPQEKRDLILALGENLILKDKKIDFRFRKPYDVLLKPDYRTNVLPRQDSNL